MLIVPYSDDGIRKYRASVTGFHRTASSRWPWILIALGCLGGMVYLIGRLA